MLEEAPEISGASFETQAVLAPQDEGSVGSNGELDGS